MEDLTFGEQVKIILGRKGMTIKRLAELIELRTGKKMSRQNLTQRLGRDNFQEQDMRMIAKILDCPFHLSIMTEAQIQPRSTAALEQEAIARTEAVEEGDGKGRGCDERGAGGGGMAPGVSPVVRPVPALVEPLYKDAEVPDCFCYQGHFTAHALKSGASRVTAIDQSEAALARAKENLALNGLDCSRAEFRCGNAFDIMREIDAERKRYDLVIMDPPPFSPSKGQLDSARRGYKELAVRGFRRLGPGGHLVFMSCSHAFTRDMLFDVLADAARDAGAVCRVVREIHQPEDHPALLGVPETDYLKGFVMGVEE